ncbi:MarR family transcriptional regulator [Natronolimnohabitans sp. A-GB9]|uniref:MarR family transcriptional regulator n=1 Tax=Natronolimnohabitans sp. A-GB9 TaxID=3069757 RepID=UPI0027B348E3|nr:MarR family transcriptional regulator [Natronolimnohabitans sp. A-GB9]MDQ2051367.1 MarR family transcriptional regulator [Natronolimnohabitans sp. A-GB9]
MQSEMDSTPNVSLPADLESPRAKLVYLYVAVSAGTTLDQLRDDLGVRKGTALSITSTLRERGYLERTEAGFELA